MNTNTNTTMQLTTANSLVICYYQCSKPAVNALNKTATKRVSSEAGAAKDATRLYNTVLPTRGTAIGKAITLQNRVGLAIRNYCLPCPAGGYYLRVKDIVEVQNIFDDAQVELDLIRQEILDSYAEILSQRPALGSFANEVRVPSATEVASKFTMSLTMINQPASISGPILSGLSEEVANRVRADSQRQVDEMLLSAHASPLQDVREQLQEFIDHMRNSQRFHTSQFDKLKDEARRLKNLNVLELPEIDEVVALAAACAASKSDDLSQYDRNAIADKATKASAKADETLASLGL